MAIFHWIYELIISVAILFDFFTFSHSFCVGGIGASSCGYHTINAPPSKSKTETSLRLRIREWQGEDIMQIQSILSSASQQSDFDPEGPLETDCASAATIDESYNTNDGGCFVVATENNGDSNTILGTAALIVGTQVAYLKSGASISTPAITGAVRRVCAIENTDNGTESILRSLLSEIETRATQSDADELIILGYPNSTRRPTPMLLKDMGYQKLPANLQVPGVNAVQYSKVLVDNEDSNISIVESEIVNNSSNNAIGSAAVGTLFVAGLLIAFGFVANIMGLEVLPSGANDNRGIGSPLSTEEVQRLKQDEQLKRTTVDGEQSREWEELGMEERREEAALMRIIQGQDIRLQ